MDLASNRYRLTIAYRGTAYAGWQRQINALAVQQVVEEALARIVGDSVTLHAASRTDAGVHAVQQVVHFETVVERPLSAWVKGANTLLPEDIRVMAVGRMPEGFHARYHAGPKEYRYRVSRAKVLSPLRFPYVVSVDPSLDGEAVSRATQYLVGQHDFRAFRLRGGSQKTTIRRIFEAEWTEWDEELEFRIVGGGFLRGMVRSIVGTLLEVGEHRREPNSMAELLEGRPRSEAGPTAPARGLVLQEVQYPPEWQPLESYPALISDTLRVL